MGQMSSERKKASKFFIGHVEVEASAQCQNVGQQTPSGVSRYPVRMTIPTVEVLLVGSNYGWERGVGRWHSNEGGMTVIGTHHHLNHILLPTFSTAVTFNGTQLDSYGGEPPQL
jgi:hypothetical protein